MSKKIWIPILGVLLAVAILLSPLSPVALSPSSPGATKSTAEIPLSIGEILDPSGNPFAHTFSDTKDIRTATYVVAASDSEHKYNADYRCDGINDQVEIQAAIDALPATGGEVSLLDGVYTIDAIISIPSNTTLSGQGPSSILKVKDNADANVHVIENSDTVGGNDHIVIKNLKFDGNKANNAGGLQVGIYLAGGSDAAPVNDCKVENCIIENFKRFGSYCEYCKNIIILANVFRGNELINLENYNCNRNIIVNNVLAESGMVGLYFSRTLNNLILGNTLQKNGWYGLQLEFESTGNIICNNFFTENSQATDNTYASLNIEPHATLHCNYNLIASNTFRQGDLANQPSYGIEIGADSIKNIIQGNDLHNAGKTANFNDAGTLTIVKSDNREIEITQVKDYIYVKNTSGGDLAAGDVVVLKAVAAGNEITTTTTEGDQNVFGMVAEAIANDAHGYTQILGKTTALKVDGTTDIAIGDLIGCFTTAKIGMKAAAGKMAFAIALEVYTTDDSNGVIDALLISPRQAI